MYHPNLTRAVTNARVDVSLIEDDWTQLSPTRWTCKGFRHGNPVVVYVIKVPGPVFYLEVFTLPSELHCMLDQIGGPLF